MKKLLTFILLIISISSYGIVVKVTKSNGGINGYKNVTEEHDCSGGAGGKHTLGCSGSGYELCAWTEHPDCSSKIIYGDNGTQYLSLDLVKMAEKEIKTGKISGRTILDGNVIFTWKYSNNISEVIIYSGSDAKPLLEIK